MKYLIYARKSTDDSGKQLLSLESQLSEMHELAEKNNLEIVKEFQESQSAKTAGRPIFAEMLQYIQDGHADAILCWKLDRISRNPIDTGTVTSLLQNSIIQEIKTYQKTYYPGDNAIVMAVELAMANQYSRDLSVNVKRGLRTKLKNGDWPWVAPIGYINETFEKKIIIDPKSSKFIKKAFEMYATGSYSYKDIEQKLYEKGFRSKSGKKVSHALLHHSLKNTFYYGIMERQGEYFKGNHKPIISKKLFDECESIRLGHNKPRRKKHIFPLRGLLTCEVCECLITAEKQRGIDYYHCTNGKGICDQKKKFIRGTELENQIFEDMEEINFHEDMIDIIHDSALEKFHSENKNKNTHKEELEKELHILRLKEDKLLDAMLDGKVENEIYEKKSKSIKLERLDLEQRIGRNSVNIRKELSTFEQAKNSLKALYTFKSDYLEAEPIKKREIAFELLSNMTLKDRKTLNLQQKMPYSIIMNGPKNVNFSTMLACLREVRTCILDGTHYVSS
jgi:DNA invertase Pin-like site-specific DNA recombinase